MMKRRLLGEEGLIARGVHRMILMVHVIKL